MKRAGRWHGCVIPGLLAAVACGDPALRAADDRLGVTILYDADERIFGPYWSVDAWFLMFLPLVTYGDNAEFEGRLARGWESSDDLRTWTFHLRSDVQWHDGVPVTAHDVKFSIELAAHPDVLFDDRKPWSTWRRTPTSSRARRRSTG